MESVAIDTCLNVLPVRVTCYVWRTHKHNTYDHIAWLASEEGDRLVVDTFTHKISHHEFRNLGMTFDRPHARPTL